jgi:hypothetical protein
MHKQLIDLNGKWIPQQSQGKPEKSKWLIIDIMWWGPPIKKEEFGQRLKRLTKGTVSCLGASIILNVRSNA